MIRARWTGRSLHSPLRAWERLALVALALLIIGFGAVTVKRSAFSQRRMTDADVYFRAAWAVRAGIDPYNAPDTNNWTYLYPPPLAILLTPLAQEPPNAVMHAAPLTPEQRLRGQLPYALCIAIWYAIGVVALVLGVHWCARAWERASIHDLVRAPSRAHTRTRRWWVLRSLPLLICLPAIGSTLVRGQVNTILLACVGGAMLLLAQRRAFAAGVATATAISLKVFPAFLALHAMLTRNWRALIGAIAASFAWIVMLPILTLGPARGVGLVRTFINVMLLPALGLGGSDAKRAEIQSASNNQSLLAIIHNWRDWQGILRERVIDPTGADRVIFLTLALFLTGITVWLSVRAGLLKGRGEPLRASLLSFALMITLMLALSPMCHNHYFALHLPLILSLVALAHDRGRSTDLWPGAWIAIGVYVLAGVLPRWPGLDLTLKPAGVQMLAGLALWGVGARELWRMPLRTRTNSHEQAHYDVPSAP